MYVPVHSRQSMPPICIVLATGTIASSDVPKTCRNNGLYNIHVEMGVNVYVFTASSRSEYKGSVLSPKLDHDSVLQPTICISKTVKHHSSNRAHAYGLGSK